MYHFIESLEQPLEVNIAIIIAILQMEKLKYRESMSFAQGHTATKWWSWGLSPSVWFQGPHNSCRTSLAAGDFADPLIPQEGGRALNEFILRILMSGGAIETWLDPGFREL